MAERNSMTLPGGFSATGTVGIGGLLVAIMLLGYSPSHFWSDTLSCVADKASKNFSFEKGVRGLSE